LVIASQIKSARSVVRLAGVASNWGTFSAWENEEDRFWP